MDEQHVGDGTAVEADPFADVWADPQWRRAFDAAAADRADRDTVAEADVFDSDVLDGDADPDAPMADPGAADADARLTFDGALVELEDVAVHGRMLIAAQYRLISDVLRDAAADPSPWVGADPTLMPGWVDVRERSVGQLRRERSEFAVRAAAADIAVRLRISETTVRVRAARADTLRARGTRLWDGFCAGRIPEANATTAATLLDSLPPDAADAWAQFDTQAATVAARLTPGKFSVAARALRDRVHPDTIGDRHERARTGRGAWVDPGLDGMATLSVELPAARAFEAFARVGADARHLRAQDGETRTLAQLRADVAADLLARGDTDATRALPARSRAVVSVIVPVLTLLGHDDTPATLDGYGPIDPDTARELAAGAPSWIRILTHPVTGVPLGMDRDTYRVPADLRRWLEGAHPTCVFPGCRRPSRDCDIDHLVDYQHGGPTSDTNLGPECPHHHQVKHETRWQVHRDPDTGTITWTSPTGHHTDTDPPPF